jgi:hypothetical protein
LVWVGGVFFVGVVYLIFLFLFYPFLHFLCFFWGFLGPTPLRATFKELETT